MMYHERALVCPEESFFLLGLRGTGKSTWLHRQFPKAKRIDLLDERQRFRLMSQPGSFALELDALQPGSWVIVDEIQKMPDLLNEAHLDILEQTLLCVRLRAYEGKLRVKERKHPKQFWIDPGLVRAAKQQLQPTLAAEERGHLFEGLVCTTLLAYRDYRRAFADLRYWAAGSSPGTEVDFLAIRNDRMVAIEVKSGAVFNETWCKGLRAFGTPPGVVRRLVVCPDTPDMRLPDGIEVLSYRRLASLLHTGILFDM